MEKRILELDFETAKSYYQSENEALKSIALQVFPELEKKELPKTWEELGRIEGYYVNSSSMINPIECLSTPINENLFVTKEQAEASIALAQLSQLREVYRNGWKPNWCDYSQPKYVIFHIKELEMNSTTSTGCNEFLSFQNPDIRDLFLENFRDLILKARPLMS